MNQIILNCILGVLGTLTSAAIGWLLSSHFKLRDDVNSIKTTLSMMSEAAARALHSPDDHLGLDYYMDLYIEHDCDMPSAQWEELKKLLRSILDDGTKTTGERNAAGMILALSYHKLRQPLPPKEELKPKP
jgi:hypothetical protein